MERRRCQKERVLENEGDEDDENESSYDSIIQSSAVKAATEKEVS